MLLASIPVEEKRRGRPPGEQFAAPIPVRLTPESVAQVTAFAEREGIKVSEAIRRLVEQALKQKRI
ncbi:ribbon-helix-helix protein, CopG family [Methylobacterium durans]|uniref:ribbon-helix-helix protein, CopG family n=1 Tax=Methylobacterium durans TaxID=2202825 RepID=UPI003C6D75DC